MSGVEELNLGQQTSIAQEIARNLDNYGDNQILDELLQNADDASAGRCAFLLDRRTHPTTHLHSVEGEGTRGLPELQGPSMLAFDDAVFQPEDYTGLMSFGKGSKKFDPTRTGKFGLGFNSTYHITESPQFVTGQSMVFLDPQKKYFPGLSPDDNKKPGMALLFKSAKDLSAMRDTMSPFDIPPFADPKTGRSVSECLAAGEEYGGTLMRFPCRSEAQASTTELRPNQSYGPDQVQRLFDAFRMKAGYTLLFLNHVQCLELWEWQEGAPAPECTFKVAMSGEELKRRSEVVQWLKAQLNAFGARKWPDDPSTWKRTPGAVQELLEELGGPGSVPRFTMKFEIIIEDSSLHPGTPLHEEWWMRCGVGQGKAWETALKDKRGLDLGNGQRGTGRLALWPYAGIAMRVASNEREVACSHMIKGSNQTIWQEWHNERSRGRAFATLPSPMVTGYPVHVNGRWQLVDSRKNLVTSESDSDYLKCEWNENMIQDSAASLWAELLTELTGYRSKEGNPITTEQYYRFWPRTGGEQYEYGGVFSHQHALMDPKSWGRVMAPLYAMLATRPVLKVRATETWLAAQHGLFDDTLALPGPNSTHRVRHQWHQLVLQDSWRSLLQHPHKNQAHTKPKPLAVFRAVGRRLAKWVRLRGNLPAALSLDSCEWLLSAPLAIRDEFERASHEQEWDCPKPLTTTPGAVRAFYAKARGSYTGGDLDACPLLGLRDVVHPCLRYCLSDLEANVEGAKRLLQDGPLPFLPMAGGDIRLLGHVVGDAAVVGGLRLLLPHTPALVSAQASAMLAGWADDKEAASLLHVIKFTPAVLARHLDEVLPGDVQGQPLIGWFDPQVGTAAVSPRSSLEGSWHRAFWKYISADECNDFGPFMEWPLLPAIVGKRKVLVAIKHAAAVLRKPLGNDGKAVKSLAPQDEIAMGILSRAGGSGASSGGGVPMLLDGYSVPYVDSLGPLPTVTPKGVLTALYGARLLGVDCRDLSGADRDALLTYFEKYEFSDEADLSMLRCLPLFEKDGTTAAADFTSIESGKWFTLPEKIPLTELEGEFLKAKPYVAPSLYKRLGIIALPRDEFYKLHIFPKFDTHMSQPERERHMRDVKQHLPELVAADKGFLIAAGSVPWLPGPEAGSLHSTMEMVSHRSQLLSDLFPHLVVPVGYRSYIWSSFLMELGLRTEPTIEDLLRCGRSLAQELDAATTSEEVGALQARGRAILEFVATRSSTGSMSDFKPNESQIRELGSLPIAPVKPHPLPADTPGLYRPPCALLAPASCIRNVDLDAHMAWSQLPVIDLDTYLYNTTAAKLGMNVSVNINPSTVADHVRFLAKLSPPELALCGDNYSLGQELKAAYSHLSKHVDDKDAMQRLRGKKCILLGLRASLGMGGMGGSRSRAGGVFVAGNQIFRELEFDVAPHAYQIFDVHNCASANIELLEALGLQETPTTGMVLHWLATAADAACGEPMNAADMTKVGEVARPDPNPNLSESNPNPK